MSSLGECIQPSCRGPLCVRGDQVQCDRCGAPVTDHPLALANRERLAREEAERKRPQRPVSLPIDYPATDRDRLAAVERDNKALRDKVASLERDRVPVAAVAKEASRRRK